MKTIDLLAGILVVITWGCNFSIIEVGLGSLDPFALTFLRFLFCAIPAIFFIRRPREIPLGYVATYGILFGVGLWGLVNYAMFRGLSPGLASVFLQFSAFITTLVCALIFGENLNAVHLVGMMLSCAGLIGIILLSGENVPLVGIALVLFAAASWAACNVVVKLAKPKNMVAFIVWSSTFSAPAVLIMTILVVGPSPLAGIAATTLPGALSVLFQAYITTIIGYMVWNNLMKRYPASQVAPLSLLVPISGVLSSYLFFHEQLSVPQLAAVASVIVGLGVFMNAVRIRRAIQTHAR